MKLKLSYCLLLIAFLAIVALPKLNAQPGGQRLSPKITATGKIGGYKFHEGVIHSHARLTYNQVYAMVEQGDVKLQKTYKNLLPHVQELFSVYRVLHASRLKRGAIDFDLPETRIVFGKGRKIERIVPLQRNDAHRLIEECMLCANISAAKFLEKNGVNHFWYYFLYLRLVITTIPILNHP